MSPEKENMKTMAEILDRLGQPWDENRLAQFETYMEGVLSWNEKVNLTAITDRQMFLVKHFADSLLCLPFEEYKKAKRVIDVGTGAGFPGAPSDKEFVLMDSLNKRLKIIDELTEKIGLTNVQTIHARAEDLARDKGHREKYDLCVSRAVANLATLAEYCIPFIKVGGYLLAYKGPDADAEIEEARKAISILGGQLVKVEKTPLAGFDLDHRILFIKKMKNTSSKYPRKSGIPSKEPLK